MSAARSTGELLIVGPSWLGDAVMMGALVQRLKAAEPARRITVLTPAHLEDLVRRLPGVDATLGNPFAHGALKLGERVRFGRSLSGLVRRGDRAAALVEVGARPVVRGHTARGPASSARRATAC